MLSRSAAALAALLAAADLAAAQQFRDFGGTTITEPWSTDLAAPGAFGRAEAGDWDGDGLVDLLVADGERVTAVFAADRCFAAALAHGAARDACALPGAPDRIAVVGDAGLDLATLDPASGTFSVASLRGAAWAGTTIVRAADLDGVGPRDLVGIAAGGGTVLLLARTAESPSAFADAGSFQALAVVHDVVPVEWDGDAGQELALSTDVGVAVYERSGALLATFGGPSADASIARIAQSGLATDRIAWIAPSAQGGQRLRTLSPAGIDESLDLGALDSFATLGRDLDLDGDDDLLVVRRSSHTMVWLENARSPSAPYGRSFSSPLAVPRVVQVAPPQSETGLHTATPAAADLDLDGDVDIAIAVESTQALVVVRGDRVAEEDQRPRLDGASYEIDPATGAGKLTLEIDAPLGLPGNPASLGVTVWHQAAVGGPVENLAVSHVEVAWPAVWPATLDVPIPQASMLFDDVYRIEVTPLEGIGSSLTKRPALAAAFAVYAGDVVALEAEPSAQPGVPVTAAWPEGPGTGSEIVPSARRGRYSDGSAPAIPL